MQNKAQTRSKSKTSVLSLASNESNERETDGERKRGIILQMSTNIISLHFCQLGQKCSTQEL